MNRQKSNRGRRDGRRRQKAGLIGLCCVAFMVCTIGGCSSSVAIPGGERIEKGYSLPQIRVIASAEKMRYEEVCTDQIWSAAVGEEGKTIEEYIKSQMKTFMEEMKVMNVMAEEREIALTPQEEEAASEAAEEYYGALTGEEKEALAVTPEEVHQLYREYCLAEKLVEELTAGMNLEVSDSEARVAVIREVKCSTEQEAESFRAAAAEAEDFSLCAENAGLIATERSLGRGEESQEVENAAFALTTGEISSVIRRGEDFVVLFCVNDYDREATKLRKEQIYAQRRKKAFQQLYADYQEEIRISYGGDFFAELDMETVPAAEQADFFTIYKKHQE